MTFGAFSDILYFSPFYSCTSLRLVTFEIQAKDRKTIFFSRELLGKSIEYINEKHLVVGEKKKNPGTDPAQTVLSGLKIIFCC